MEEFATAPDFIPEDVQAPYIQTARQTVAQPAAPTRAGRRHGPQRADEHQTAYVATALLGFLGVFALSALWGWLAVSMQQPIWWWLFAAGMALTLCAALAVARVLVVAPSAVPLHRLEYKPRAHALNAPRYAGAPRTPWR